jgi:receptor expression-enhancing protein 1/2/3/4
MHQRYIVYFKACRYPVIWNRASCEVWGGRLVLAVMTMAERAADQLIFWMPMYSEAKVALVVYLWHPRTQGALFLYDSFLQPFLSVRRRRA